MIQSGSMARRDRAPGPGGARPVARGAAPAVAGLQRPGFVADRLEAAMLDKAGLPLVRRGRRLHDGFGRRVAGSGAAHLLVLVLMALSFAHPPGGGKPQEQQPVDMVYERAGSSGMTGPSAPNPAATPPPPASAAPTLQPPTPTPPVPDVAPPPDQSPPLPELKLPEPLPQPMPNPVPQSQSQSRAATARPQSRSTSPLSHPMDLSFAPATRTFQRRSGRRAGSGAPIDMSLGPLVQNGQLNTPYASTSSIKGVSNDYAEEIGDWIRRHMYYPEEAARKGEDGPSHVHVVLDRQGQVRAVRLVTTSGSYLLDDATTGMFRNAKLPPVPPDMSGDHFDVDLTIDYILIRH